MRAIYLTSTLVVAIVVGAFCSWSDPSQIPANIALFAQDGDHGFQMSLSIWPIYSDHVKEVVSFNNLAIPELIKGLQSPNPMIVGQSALCLELLKDHTALPAVKDAYDKWIKMNPPKEDYERWIKRIPPPPGTMEADYAIARLDNYIRDVEEIPN